MAQVHVQIMKMLVVRLFPWTLRFA